MSRRAEFKFCTKDLQLGKILSKGFEVNKVNNKKPTMIKACVSRAFDIKVKFFGARWIFSRLPSPIHFSKNLDRQGIPWPFGWLQKYFLLRLGGIPVFREENKGFPKKN